MAQDETIQTAVRRLHVSRMSTYMDAAGHDPALALRLYIWNVQVSAALYETISVTEVILRNAMDEALRRWCGYRR